MAVTGHKIYIVGNIAYIDQIVDSGSAMQFEGLAKNCLHRKKYTNSTEFSFSGFNGLDETKAFPFAQLKDGNGDAWADQATFEAWATSNLGKSSAGDSAYLILDGTLTSQSDTDAPTVDWITQVDGVTTGTGAIEMGYSNVGEYTFDKVGYFEAAHVFFDASLFVGSDSGAITSLIPLYEFSAPDALFIRCAKVSDGSANNNEITNVRFRITIKQ